NQQQLGAILITKTGKDKACTGANTPTISNGVCTGPGTANLSGATFTIKDSGGTAVTASPATTGANGTVCVDKLPWSGTGTNSSVQETGAPTGYSIDTTTAQTVTVSKNSTCGDGNEAKQAFSDTPLTNILVRATSVAAGATNSTISCTNMGGTVVASSGSTAKDPAEANTTTAPYSALPPG